MKRDNSNKSCLFAAFDSHKLLWHLDRVLNWQQGQTVAPIYIEVSPTTRCNYKCIFCAMDFAQDEAIQLDASVYICRLPEMRQAGVKSIMLAGEGEPFLHPALPDMVIATRENGIDVSITTNGSLAGKHIWKDILGALEWIRFSVNSGSRETFGQVHGASSLLFSKVLENIAAAVQCKHDHQLKTTIGVQYVVLPENIAELEKALALFADLGVDYLMVKPFSRHPLTCSSYAVKYNDDQIQEIESVVRRMSSRISIAYRRHAFYTFRQQAINFKKCCGLSFSGYITANGNFHTCNVFVNNPHFEAGNIYDQTMDDILNGNKRLASIHYGENILVPSELCRTNCRLARINEFLDTLTLPPEHINFI